MVSISSINSGRYTSIAVKAVPVNGRDCLALQASGRIFQGNNLLRIQPGIPVLQKTPEMRTKAITSNAHDRLHSENAILGYNQWKEDRYGDFFRRCLCRFPLWVYHRRTAHEGKTPRGERITAQNPLILFIYNTLYL